MRPSILLTLAGGVLLVACASADGEPVRRQKLPYPLASTSEAAMAPPVVREEPVTKRDHSVPRLETHAHFQSSPPPRPFVDRPPRPPGPRGPGSK